MTQQWRNLLFLHFTSSSSQRLEYLLSTRQTSTERAMSSMEPSEHLPFERATLLGSTQIRLSRPEASGVNLSETSNSGAATLGELAGDASWTAGQEQDLDAWRPTTEPTETTPFQNSQSVLHVGEGALWSIEEDETLLKVATKRHVGNGSKGGHSYWSAVEGDMKEYWALKRVGNFDRTLSALKSRVKRLRSIQEVGLTPRTYHPRQWTAEEDAKVLALNSTGSSVASYAVFLKLFDQRPTFEIKDRRYKLLADQKRMAAAEEKRKQLHTQLLQEETSVGTSSSPPLSSLSQKPSVPPPRSQSSQQLQASAFPSLIPVREDVLPQAGIAKTVPLVPSSTISNRSSRLREKRPRPSLSRFVPSPSPTSFNHQVLSYSSRLEISPPHSSASPSLESRSHSSTQNPFAPPPPLPFHNSDSQGFTFFPNSPISNPRKRFSIESSDVPLASRRKFTPSLPPDTVPAVQRMNMLAEKEAIGEGIRLFEMTGKRQDELDLEWEKVTEGKM
ncbi:hypothetical protein JCM3765_001495 [Sporobolomyces pararoseus]